MRGATASVERHVLRGRGIASWILIAVLGLSAGVTMALVAGGRRAATSYDRLIAWADVDDAELFGLSVDCALECGSAQADGYLTFAESLPFVESSERSIRMSDKVIGPNGQHYVGISLEAIAIGLHMTGDRDTSGEHVKLLDGRFFSPSAVNEALIPFDVAERFNLQVGDDLTIVVDDELQITEDVQITGIIAHPGAFPSFAGASEGTVLLTPAFADAHTEYIDWTNAGVSVQLRDGADGLDDYSAALIDGGVQAQGVSSIRERAPGPRQLVRFDAGVLWLLAAVVGFGSVVVISQIIRRATTAAAPELVTLCALGMRRIDLAAAATRNGLRTGALGVVVAAAVAIAGSALFPVGISRTAEPHPGISVDLVVLGIGMCATLLLTMLLTCGSTLLVSRRTTPTGDRRYTLASLANRLPPASASGVRLALTPANAGPGATLRVGLLGLGSILATLVAALSLTASLNNAIADPTLTGGTWDGAVTYFGDQEALMAAHAALVADERIENVALAGWSFFASYSVTVNGREVHSQVLDTAGGIDIATDRGRGPREPNEIALGEAELDALGVGVGDEVQVAVDGGPSQTATVVGRAVLASSRFRALLQGEGAAVTPAFMSRLGNEQSVFAYVVKLRDDSHINLTIEEVREEHGSFFAFTRPDRAGIQSLRAVRSTINIVLIVLGILAVAALLHRLIVTARSQRQQIAVLRAMGLTGQQVMSAGAVTGLVVVASAALFAVPVGIVAGVVGWRAIAEYLGVIPVSIVPAMALVVLLAAFIAVGVAVGTAVVERVRRRSPGSLLRTE